MRIAPETDFRLHRGALSSRVSLPVGRALVLLKLLVMPRHSVLNLIKASILSVGQSYLTDQPAVGPLDLAIECDALARDQITEMLS